MDNKKKNKIIIGVLLIIIVILSVLCILFATGTISFKSNDVNNEKTNHSISDNSQINQDETNNNLYKLGDDVVLTSLSNINYSSIGFPEETGNFSQWKFLKEEGDYITLYYVGDELLYGKADKNETISKYNERKVLFTSNGINFGNDGEIRILNESDLLLLGCSFETLTCSNSPDWIFGWTSYTNANYKYTLSNGKLAPIESNIYVLVISKPVIKILKSNIK